jgi:hypothetical protein
LIAEALEANKTTGEARFQTRPLCRKRRKRNKRSVIEPLFEEICPDFEKNMGNKPTSLGEDNGTHFNFSSFQIQA